ncbi:MAG: hypothetical protein GWM92_15780 [Gemmatimonadetes bacterium]|nr:hypothetical protein [Gemmatimonadota bacterium]NIR80192.1 hypothetical protein [Gemmatimonadota bacterium]NIT88954.1 hypothetical protein [Gemmatimonadota bacterium]NIU32749.1 hypothetical protein [Gemmatimonadota bacterium]NIU37181.1 hypothetical protein [Gemmatimonadota bacterium]
MDSGFVKGSCRSCRVVYAWIPGPGSGRNVWRAWCPECGAPLSPLGAEPSSSGWPVVHEEEPTFSRTADEAWRAARNPGGVA